MQKYKVFFDYRTGGKYIPRERVILAESEKDACAKLKAKHLPGYDRQPYHVRAELYEEKVVHVCTYINGKGDTRVKYFDDEDSGLEFCRTLDKRIERGTCGGYAFSRV